MKLPLLALPFLLPLAASAAECDSAAAGAVAKKAAESGWSKAMKTKHAGCLKVPGYAKFFEKEKVAAECTAEQGGRDGYSNGFEDAPAAEILERYKLCKGVKVYEDAVPGAFEKGIAASCTEDRGAADGVRVMKSQQDQTPHMYLCYKMAGGYSEAYRRGFERGKAEEYARAHPKSPLRDPAPEDKGNLAQEFGALIDKTANDYIKAVDSFRRK